MPLLSPYEAEVALGASEWLSTYPMDYYSKAGGTWANYALEHDRKASRERCCKRAAAVEAAEGGCGQGGCGQGGCGQGATPSPPPSPPASPPSSPRASGEAASGCLAGGGGYSLVDDGVRHGGGLLERCCALERRCFAKHEAMDLPAETRGRGALLVCAIAAPAWPDLGSIAAAGDGRPPPPQVAGYLVLQRSSLAASVAKLVVAPAHRRQGLGRLLLERALQIAREGRAQLCSLNVDTSNEPALTLYRGVGFRVASTRRDYYCVGRDAYAMEVSLAEQ